MAEWKSLLAELRTLQVKYKTAKKEERDAFVSAWQGNVRRVLCEGDKYGLFTIREASYQFPAGS